MRKNVLGRNINSEKCLVHIKFLPLVFPVWDNTFNCPLGVALSYPEEIFIDFLHF